MKKSYAFNSVEGDRKYNADNIADNTAIFYSNGIVVQGGSVLGTQLKVSAVSGMQIKVADGTAIIQGRTVIYSGTSDGSEIVTLETADLTHDRIDRIVLELNLASNVRDIVLKSIQGTPATSPVAPTLTRNDVVYQISLAQIRIIANTSTIGTITDERGNSSVCGISNVIVGITPPTGNDASTIMLGSSVATLYGLIGTDANVNKALEKANPLASNQILSATSATLYGLVGINANVDKALQAAYPLASSQKLSTATANMYGLTGTNANSDKALASLLKKDNVVILITSGTWTPPRANMLLDIFLLGGGGGGGGGNDFAAGGGGGGGYAKLIKDFIITSVTPIPYSIGAGGSGGAYASSTALAGGVGGKTEWGTNLGYITLGGSGGTGSASNAPGAGGAGGAGGGGGAASAGGFSTAGAGASGVGGSGTNGGGGAYVGLGGNGYFYEEITGAYCKLNNILYGGAGSGGACNAISIAGGAGGGGAGGYTTVKNGVAGSAYGAGGGGACYQGAGGAGYQGAIIIAYNN